MRKNHLYKTITSILISSFILIPVFSVPKKVEAQTISGYTSGLAPAIAQLPQCKAVINSGIKSLFSGVGELLSSRSEDGSYSDAINGRYAKNPLTGDTEPLPGGIGSESDLTTISNEAGNQFDSIQVTDQEVLNKLKEQGKALSKINIATESLNANSTCIQSIGRLIIKMLLQKMTVSTIDWINSGFDGSPAFIQDPGKFFNDIAKNEVLQFGLEITDPELFPFGKDWIRNNALTFNNKFQQNAQYSLNELIKQTNPEYDATTFGQDFSMGGWDAWTAMTQVPANNPLGFKLMADNEIQKRLTGTAQSNAQNIRDALQEANGFLGDQRCVNPEGITREQHNKALQEGNKGGLCLEWQYVTPGKMISDAATTAMGYQNNAYLNVTDLNDAVAAILDALLGQFSSNLMEKGFANMGNEGANGALVYDSIKVDPYKSQVEKDFMPSQLSSSWLQANPDFDIRTDLTQAVIDEQRTYSDKLAQQNKELMSTTDGKNYVMSENGISNAYGLLPAIYQLDYCIPGPHPNWKADSQKTLNDVMNLVIPETEGSVENKESTMIVGTAKTIAPLAGAAVGASMGSAVPVVGTLIGAAVGVLVGGLIEWVSGDDALEKLAKYYASQIQALTGLKVNPNEEDKTAGNNILNKQGMVQGINDILRQYAEKIDLFYNPKLLPSVTKEATTSFYQTTGYSQMIKNNEDKISSLKNTVNSLNDIKEAVDNLNDEYPTSKERGEEYENKLKIQINAFGRLSANMVNGDDIAKADNLLKQIIDKKNYVYNTLLKGPYGCEKDLENKLPNGELVYQVRNTKRMTYPFPIIYDYNKVKTNDYLPDPWNSGFKKNKMTFNTSNVAISFDGKTTEAQGPAFLPYVFYQKASVSDNEKYQRAFCTDIDSNTSSNWCMIEIRHLFPLHDGENTVGIRKGWMSKESGQFETTIGIY